MSRVRQQRHSEELRSRILETAQKIILEDGINALSVRRVASEIDYAAPVIYQYYRNKNHLISCAIQEGYRKILESVEPIPPNLSPDEELRISFKHFMDSAMQVPKAYKAFVLQISSELLAETSVLGKDGSKKSPTLASIISSLESGIDAGLFLPCNVQLTARVYWCAMFGLFFRLILETDISAEEREALIQRHLDVLLRGISAH
ncbi:MAG: TetR/AcrR family transcriptional regulator [Eubacterium sp.]|jgi:AcrR family transcriptional regulator|nr:TetR/AcrR family transcriptional regulator [Eubacterium sp.]